MVLKLSSHKLCLAASFNACSIIGLFPLILPVSIGYSDSSQLPFFLPFSACPQGCLESKLGFFFLTLWQSFCKYCREQSMLKYSYKRSLMTCSSRGTISIHSYPFCGHLWPSQKVKQKLGIFSKTPGRSVKLLHS